MEWNSNLTEPVLGGIEISPLIEDNIEDGHDADHRVEGGKSSPRGKLPIVVDNHEDKENEDSGHKVHHHLQY